MPKLCVFLSVVFIAVCLFSSVPSVTQAMPSPSDSSSIEHHHGGHGGHGGCGGSWGCGW